MIPPLKTSRLRAIELWMKHYAPTSRRAAQSPDAIDTEMIAAFDAKVDQIQSRMMDTPEWGTAQATAQFKMAQMEAWQEVSAAFLPVTSAQQSAD